MKIHWLQHVPFEGLGCIEPWLTENGHTVSCTRLWAGDELPLVSNQRVGQASLYSEILCLSSRQDQTRSRIREACPTIKARQFSHDIASVSDIDGLIVMGGPMGIYDDEQHSWLAVEKAFIKAVIDQNKPVLGICLGAQLIADVLGSNVWKNEHKEIGFFPMLGSSDHEISKDWKHQTVFHWHGDTFGIPDGAVRLAASEATENQAFVYKDNVLALQFHLETTEESLRTLYENVNDEMTDGPFIQTWEEMRAFFPMLGKCNELMFALLNGLF